MISYVTLGASNLATAKAFYSELLSDLGAKVLIDMDRICFLVKVWQRQCSLFARPLWRARYSG